MIIIVERNSDVFRLRPISLRLKGSSRCSKTFHCVPRLILKFFSQILELNITTKTHILSQPVYWLTPNEEVARIIKVIVGAGFQVGNKRFDLFVTCLVLFVSSVRSSFSHPDLLVIHHPLFQITPVLNTGLSLSEPLQLYQGQSLDLSADS